jgi:hypothetical protein
LCYYFDYYDFLGFLGANFMVSISKIFVGVFLGSLFLIFAATRLLLPSEIVSASTEKNNDPITDNVEISEEQEPNCSMSVSFPEEIQQWCDLIEENSFTYDLDPDLIAAVMLQESGGDQNAYSTSGAVGLMQIMPKDGIAANFMCINGPCFSNRPGMAELYDPQLNIEYGSRMLSNLFEKYGDWREALRAYGPMDVGYHYADLVLSIYENYQ